jgi:hypothetical protein
MSQFVQNQRMAEEAAKQDRLAEIQSTLGYLTNPAKMRGEVSQEIAGTDFTPQKTSDGRISGLFGEGYQQPLDVQEYWANKKALEEADRRSFDAEVTSGPGVAIDSNALAAEVDQGKSIPARTREGYLAGRDRMFREAIKKIVAQNKAANEALRRGEKAEYSGPITTSAVSMSPGLQSGVKRTAEGEAFRKQKAEELAQRKANVVAKSQAQAAGMSVPELQQLQQIAAAMQQRQQMTQQAWQNVQGEGGGKAGDYLVLGGAEAGKLSPENRNMQILQALALANQSNPNGMDIAGVLRALGIGNPTAVGGESVDMTGDTFSSAIKMLSPQERQQLADSLKQRAETTGDAETFKKWAELERIIKSEEAKEQAEGFTTRTPFPGVDISHSPALGLR